jgi:hypothetical protein
LLSVNIFSSRFLYSQKLEVPRVTDDELAAQSVMQGDGVEGCVAKTY